MDDIYTNQFKHGGYRFVGRASGTLMCVDMFNKRHKILKKIIPEFILYHFFRWNSGRRKIPFFDKP